MIMVCGLVGLNPFPKKICVFVVVVVVASTVFVSICILLHCMRQNVYLSGKMAVL